MNKKAIVIIGVVLLAIGGGMAYLLGNDDAGQEMDDMTSQTTSDTSSTATSVAENMPTPGAYVEYSDTAIAQAEGTKLLFFHAPWCPQCRDLEADIEAKGIPDGVTIIKVDYDSNQALRKQYGITLQTTFARINDSGELEEKFVAYDDPRLEPVLENLL
jgi:thiol-disulfide isomerase/thioredoxin